MGNERLWICCRINPDEDAPIKDECDIFIKGRMEDVIPLLIEEIKKQIQIVETV